MLSIRIFERNHREIKISRGSKQAKEHTPKKNEIGTKKPLYNSELTWNRIRRTQSVRNPTETLPMMGACGFLSSFCSSFCFFGMDFFFSNFLFYPSLYLFSYSLLLSSTTLLSKTLPCVSVSGLSLLQRQKGRDIDMYVHIYITYNKKERVYLFI